MRTASRHSHFYDLLDALAQPGCALCCLAARTRWRFLDSLAYENVNDPATREKLRASLGFCNRHAWFFVERVREVFGAAIIYRDVLHAIQRRAANTASPDPFMPSGPCLACVAESRATDDAILTLVEAIGDEDFRSSFLGSDGLCASHLRRLLAVTRGEGRSTVLRLALEVWDEDPSDPVRLRQRAAAEPLTFGTDDLALQESPRSDLAIDLPPEMLFGCPVCEGVLADLRARTTWRELDDGESVICNVHAWMPAGADASELYRRQLRATRAEAEARSERSESLVRQAIRGLGLARPPNAMPLLPVRCAVCAHQARIEARLCREEHGVLCLPHLRRAIQLQGHASIARVRTTWRELDALLGEYLRKEDYRFRREPRGQEQRSPWWAVELVSGQPGIR